MLENLLGITDEYELAREEERLTKRRAVELFDNGILDALEVGTFDALSKIHQHLFQDVYAFSGKTRQENIAKGGFRFASVMYLPEALRAIDAMPHSTFDEIVAKYIEMNIAHPFREGNGRSTRIWLDQIFKESLDRVVDWSAISKEDYLLAMQRSPVKDLELKSLLHSALAAEADSRALHLTSIDASYRYEGYTAFKAEDLD